MVYNRLKVSFKKFGDDAGPNTTEVDLYYLKKMYSVSIMANNDGRKICCYMNRPFLQREVTCLSRPAMQLVQYVYNINNAA